MYKILDFSCKNALISVCESYGFVKTDSISSGEVHFLCNCINISVVLFKREYISGTEPASSVGIETSNILTISSKSFVFLAALILLLLVLQLLLEIAFFCPKISGWLTHHLSNSFHKSNTFGCCK